MTNFAQNTCYTETYLDFSGMFFVVATRKWLSRLRVQTFDGR